VRRRQSCQQIEAHWTAPQALAWKLKLAGTIANFRVTADDPRRRQQSTVATLWALGQVMNANPNFSISSSLILFLIYQYTVSDRQDTQAVSL
jgi:hypothetical protein